MADYYVVDPFAVVSVGDQVKVKVLGVDLERKRVQLSMKTGESKPKPKTQSQGDRRSKRNDRPARRDNRNDDVSPTNMIKGNISWS